MYHRRNRIASAEIGTNDWIWSHPSYLEWEERASGILWIEGKPGSGKSVLAMSIWEHFLQKSGLDKSNHNIDRAGSPGDSALISSWFYSTRDNLVAHVWMLRSILFQILEQNPSLFPHAQHIYRKRRRQSSRNGLEWGASPMNKTQWDPGEFGSVLPSISENSTTPIFCVLDGLDESADGSNNQENILSLLNKVVKNSTKIKVIILSRLTVDIEKKLRKCYHIVMQDENSADVAKIIDVRVQSLIKALRKDDSSDEDTEEEFSENDEDDDNEKLGHLSHGNTREGGDPGTREKSRNRSLLTKTPTGPSKRQEKDFELSIDKEDKEVTKIQQYLSENARGVVLWVTTVLDTLQEKLRRPLYDLREIRNELERLPKDLQDLYHDIAKGLHDSLDTSELEMARRALMWTSVVTSTHRFHVTELFDALRIDSKVDLETNSEIYPRRNFAIRSRTQARRKLQRLCGPFIEIIPPADRTDYGLPTHTSTTERDKEVQLLHQTVKDFLEDERRAGQLYIPFQAAQRTVEEDSRIYVRIALPAKAKDYSPLPVWDFRPWTSCRQEVIEYLEQRHLLPFILGNYPNLKDEVSGKYFFFFRRSELTPNLTQSEVPEPRLGTIASEASPRIAGPTSADEAIFLFSDYFEVTWTQGYITATRILLHLATLSSYRGVLSATSLAKILLQMADRIKSQMGKFADPATTKAAQTLEFVKVDSARYIDFLRATYDFYQPLGLDIESFLLSAGEGIEGWDVQLEKFGLGLDSSII